MVNVSHNSHDRRTGFHVFFLLVFWPVGIVLVWRSGWHVVAKVLASVYVVVAVYFSYNMFLTVQAMQAAGMA